MGKYANPHFDRQSGQWSQLIGYTLNRSKGRVRRRFYFGTDEDKSRRESIAKQIEWQKIVEATKPVWADENLVHLKTSTLSPATIAQAKQLFLDHKKSQVGLAGGRGIKPSTYNGLLVTLNLALGRQSIDTTKPLAELTKSDLEKYVTFWMGLPDGISTRTAINYCTSLKQFLDWCDAQDFGWEKPKGTDDLFAFRGMKQTTVAKYDPNQLKTLLAEAQKQSPKTLLYCLLALQCGHYQSDIGWLMHSEIQTIKGETFIYRKRTKLKGVDEEHDDDGKQYVLTWLFPETAALIEQLKAPEQNIYGRLLLNTNMATLWSEELGEVRRDAISPAYERVTAASGVRLAFKQLRKMGWQSMKRIGKSDDLARRWAGQRVQGISRNYNHDDFTDVTKALKVWRKELVGAGVLPKSLQTAVAA